MALKLLIVQEDSLFRRHLSERMRMEEHLVFEAAPESEAVDIVGKTNIDVVLLGPVRPRQVGLSVLKAIKEIRPYTEVILLTPLEEHSLYDSIQAMQLGAFDDLLVPLDLSALRNRIQDAYARKKERVRSRRAGTGRTAGRGS